MKNIQHILVPTDFEPDSAEAIELATSFAQRFGAKVTLLHVWQMPIYPYMEFMLNTDIITRVEEAATERLAVALVSLKQTLPNAESMLKMGLPWQSILDVVVELKPDLVVMGTHGRSGLPRAFLGSVAERVVRLSPAPVLTVRALPHA